MAINGDMYLFDPRRFLGRIREAAAPGSGGWCIDPDRLRRMAMEAFDRNPAVPPLADLYGDWYRSVLVEEAEKEASGTVEHHADLWASLLLFDSFLEQRTPTHVGGQSKLKDIDTAIRNAYGWMPPFRNGHRLSSLLAPAPVDAESTRFWGPYDLRRLLSTFTTNSTSCTVGWLSWHDLLAMQYMLSNGAVDPDLVAPVLAVVGEAVEKKTSLCIIISG